MTGSIDDVDAVADISALDFDGTVLGEDGDPPLSLERIAIEDQAVLSSCEAVELLVAEHSRLIEEAVDQRRLAVVDMGDDRHVSNLFLHRKTALALFALPGPEVVNCTRFRGFEF